MKHLLAIVLLALPVAAFAGPKEEKAAQKHIARATEAHQAEKFDVALTELEAAYALDPQPDLLYAIGQVHVKLGQCAEAIASYDKFLATKPPADAVESANEAITTCKTQLPPPAPEPTPAPSPAPAPASVALPTAAPQAASFDRLGAAMVGAGVASVVVGAVLYSNARATLDDADSAGTYERHRELVDHASLKRNVSVGFGAVGLVAIGVGVWHYARFNSEHTITIAPGAGGGTVSWTERF